MQEHHMHNEERWQVTWDEKENPTQVHVMAPPTDTIDVGGAVCEPAGDGWDQSAEVVYHPDSHVMEQGWRCAFCGMSEQATGRVVVTRLLV